jgi:hypothetical protein
LLKRAIPKLYEIADVNVEPRLLDKEFRDILNTNDPEIHTSPHFADYIIEVPTKDGKGQWILCHLEAQGPGGTDLSERMFFYMCLIYAHYRRMPVGLAIITDGHKKESRFFEYNHFDLKTLYQYYNVVLEDLDYGELEASDNPVDLALCAAKFALRTKEELRKYTYLHKLTELLTERGWNANEKRNLRLFMVRIINLKDKILQDKYLEYSLELDKEGKLMYEPFLKEAEERMLEKRIKEEMARNFLADGYSPEAVAKNTRLPVEQVRNLI